MLLYLKIRGRYKSLSSERRRLNFYRFFQDEVLIGDGKVHYYYYYYY